MRPPPIRQKAIVKKRSALLALPTLTLGTLALTAGPATAADSWSFHAQLAPVNNSTAAGTATLQALQSDNAVINGHGTMSTPRRSHPRPRVP